MIKVLEWPDKVLEKIAQNIYISALDDIYIKITCNVVGVDPAKYFISRTFQLSQRPQTNKYGNKSGV